MGLVVQAMSFDRIADIRKSGFEGFVPISALQASGCCEVPDKPGVYLVLRPNKSAPKFLKKSRGGFFKGKDPTANIACLKNEKWVKHALVLYVGKAGPGKTSTLRSRLKQYMRFGQKERAAHWGGRYIWQLSESTHLLICWQTTGSSRPRIVEKRLIREFEDSYGKLPFANLRH